MKVYLIAAGALLLSTPAQAWTLDTTAALAEKSDAQMKVAVLDVLHDAKVQANARLAAGKSEYQGMGGPIAETDYPPCAPGPGDDRCIQLYEPGVTGVGN